jgi:periplasmic mercuric ion binding protein
MKKLFFLLLACCGLAASPATAQTKNPKSAQVQIKTSAVCGMCKATLEKAMAYEKGVQTSELDVASQMLTILFRPDKTSVEKLRLAVSRTGYDADSVEADPRAYQRLDECCKKDAGVHLD